LALSAKDLRVAPISSAAARAIIQKFHYSGKATVNAQLHLGVFLGNQCHGVMQFGPPLDRRKLLPLVKDTPWDGMLELNRMAFSDALPRNSESRALAVAMRLMRKHYPHLQWIVSFADGTQCGDGTIYRASGFALTQIRRNKTLLRAPDGKVVSDVGLRTGQNKFVNCGKISLYKQQGYVPLDGFQLRYIYFLDPTARERLTCDILPFSSIAEAGAAMYKGQRARSTDSGTSGDQPEGGGAIPTRALNTAATPEV
jgi:hypothetical protein